MRFSLWGKEFRESVRVAANLPSTVLIGSQFWRKHGLHLDLAADLAEIWVQGRRIKGKVRRQESGGALVELAAAVRDAEVDEAIVGMDFSTFHPRKQMQERLQALLWRQRAVFKGLGCIKGVKHEIKLEPAARPVCCPVWRRLPKEEEVEREAMKRLLELGVVEHATSPWAACNVFVKKKDGSTRVTSDFRGLKSVTVTDSYPTEEVRATLDWMGGKRVFSTIDLKDGFFQIELDENSKDYTAVRTVLGLLRYVRLPQGLKHSPAAFQRVINIILGDRKGRDVWAFMDDVSLGTESAEDHLGSLESVLRRFLDAGARLKFSKCQFGVRAAEILGHCIDEDGLKPSAAHVKAIRELVEPGNGEELMRFLGLVNYFSDFVDHFAEIARPLHAVLRGTGFNRKKRRGTHLFIKDWGSRWGSCQRKAWEELKKVLGDPEFLASPRRGAAKKVMTDASGYGLGGVLLQEESYSKWRPIAFTSRKLTESERKFTVTERECLAVVHGLRKWRPYLHGEKGVTIVTDHCSLKWLMSLRDLRGRLARWMVEVQDFDFTVQYAPGSALVVPDTLSRDAVEKPLCQRCFAPIELRLEGSQNAEDVRAVVTLGAFGGGPTAEQLREAQLKAFGDPAEWVAADGRDRYSVTSEGLLCFRPRGPGSASCLVIPPPLVGAVLQFVHGSRMAGHYGIRRTEARIRGRYWWPAWKRDVRMKIARCVACTAVKAARPGRGARMQVYHPARRFQQVAVDVQTITPRTRAGNIKVLVIIDTFTRFALRSPDSG